MSSFRIIVVTLVAWLCASTTWAGQDVADVTGEVTFRDDGGHVSLVVPLSEAVPWKIWHAVEPSRIVVEFNDVNWQGAPTSSSVSIADVVTERHDPAWSRLVAYLHEPLAVDQAEMSTLEDGSAVLSIVLSPVTGAMFRDQAKSLAELEANTRARPFAVVIDPGHGGRDPGAEAGPLNEADLMLEMAFRLRDALQTNAGFEVVLTREKDEFVHLETRVGRARKAEADVFISLHADRLAVNSGDASGLVVYSLSADLADDAAERQASRHGLSEVLKGVDLTDAGDDVALALMGLHQLDTQPRTAALSRALVDSVKSAGLNVNSRPERQGNFAVLKAADVPSVLVELGFLSSEEDLARLESEQWRDEIVRALTDGLLQWYQDDEALRDGRRK